MELILNDVAPLVGDNETEARLAISAKMSDVVLQASPRFLNAGHKAAYILSLTSRLDGIPDATRLEYYLDGGHMKQDGFLDPASVEVPDGYELACYNYMGGLYDYVIRAERYGNGVPLEQLSGKCAENWDKFKWLMDGTHDYKELMVSIGATQFAKPWLRSQLGIDAATANGADVFTKSNQYRHFTDDYDSAVVMVTKRAKVADRQRYFRSEINDVLRGFEFLKPIAGELREVNEVFYRYVLDKPDVTPVYMYTSQIVVLQPIGTSWNDTLTLKVPVNDTALDALDGNEDGYVSYYFSFYTLKKA